jgi:hypothetical protein
MLWNTVMLGRPSEINEPIDRKTSRSICNAVGERLQRNLPLDATGLPGGLQNLMDELRRRDHAADATAEDVTRA